MPLSKLFQLYHGDNSLIHDPWVNKPDLGQKICLAKGYSTMTTAPRLGIEPGINITVCDHLEYINFGLTPKLTLTLNITSTQLILKTIHNCIVNDTRYGNIYHLTFYLIQLWYCKSQMPSEKNTSGKYYIYRKEVSFWKRFENIFGKREIANSDHFLFFLNNRVIDNLGF